MGNSVASLCGTHNGIHWWYEYSDCIILFKVILYLPLQSCTVTQKAQNSSGTGNVLRKTCNCMVSWWRWLCIMLALAIYGLGFIMAWSTLVRIYCIFYFFLYFKCLIKNGQSWMCPSNVHTPCDSLMLWRSRPERKGWRWLEQSCMWHRVSRGHSQSPWILCDLFSLVSFFFTCSSLAMCLSLCFFDTYFSLFRLGTFGECTSESEVQTWQRHNIFLLLEAGAFNALVELLNMEVE